MLAREDMLAALLPAPSAHYRPRLGLEWEIQLFSRDTLMPLGPDGPQGAAEVFARARALTGAQPLPDQPDKKARLPGGGYLSMEPGAQLELSSAPAATFADIVSQVDEFVELVERLCAEMGLHAFYGGANPVHDPDTIGLVVATPRYRIMDAYFPRVGTMGRRMMRQSCSVQVTLDFPGGDVDAGTELFRAGMSAAPLLAAIASNSPFIDGRRTPYRSFRAAIWGDTDPSRSRAVPGFGDPDFTLDRYVDHAVRAPMFFVVGPRGELLDARGMTFEEFLAGTWPGIQPTLADFEIHNTTLFTDVRLKRTVEIRSMDGQDPFLVPALVALVAGALMTPGARREVLELLGGLWGSPGAADYDAVSDALGREGLTGQLGGRPVVDLGNALLDIAARGLTTAVPDAALARAHLDRLGALVAASRTPADVVLERFGDDPRAWLAAGRTFDR